MRLRHLSLSRIDFFARLNPHRHDNFHDFVLDHIEHRAEQFKRFALVFLLRIFLRIAAQMDALSEMIKCRQMFAPMRVDALQHHATLETGKRFLANHFDLAGIGRISCLQHFVE